MAQTALDLTLETIRDIVVAEVKFLCGVGGQIKGAQQELKRMRIILEEFDTVQDQSALNFIKEIKQICYEIEDGVDAYASQVLLRRQNGSILRRIAGAPLECYRVHDAGSQMASVNSDISALNSRMECHKKTKDAIGAPERRKGGGWPRETYGLEADKDFVGMKFDLKLVVSRLLMKDSGPVVSIWGMGGSGKTTLSEQVFHDGDVRREFQAFAWIYVSRSCKVKSIFQGLLNQLNSQSFAETNAMEEAEFVREIYAVLRRIKCLIVLDDVWEVQDWKSIFGNLNVGDTQSKVLVTTRKQVVADLGLAHPIGLLSPDDAWKLLQKKAFPRTPHPQGLDLEPETLERIGRNIVRQCGYLPLAIRVVGGILSKRATSDWKEMNDKIDLYVRKADGSKDEEIKQVLSLSYDDLPYHLKPCFLYFSRFPHDEVIRAEELYMLWMAEGIVSPENQGQDEASLMELAKQCLRDLVSRSMVQVQVDEITAPQEFQSCRLHDLLRDLCTETAAEEEYLKLVDCRGGKNSPRSLSSSNSRLRRLAVYLEDPGDDISLTEESSQRLRSLFIHVPKPVYLFQDLVGTLPPEVKLERFKFLRVLGFQYVKFEDKKALAGIGKLIHLRLLAFMYCHLLELPSSIGDFPSLQTLNLETRSFLLIPDVLWKLKRLKYLNVLNAGCANGKLSLSGLDELEALHGFSSNNCKVADLATLTTLRSLKAEIYGNADLFQFIDSIEGSRMRLTMSAVVICDCDFTSVGGGASLLRKLFGCANIHGLSVPGIAKIGRLPRYELGFFPNLAELNLQGGEIEEDPMPTLEKLPKLRKLVLVEKSFVGREMVCHAQGFAQLRYLKLNRLSNLEVWRIDNGAMKQLSFLELSSCHGLDMIPEGVRFLTALQTLEIADMSANFQQRIGGGGEDFDIVSHVNSIFIHF